VHGEIWRAVADRDTVPDGAAVRVVDVQGLTLKVVMADQGGVHD
jgi:membrane protein implicated in regulation of membrane protease activity